MLEAFARWLTLRGTVSVTNKSHLKVLRMILRQCQPLTPTTFERLLTSLLENGRTPSTINQYVSTVRLWAKFNNLDEKLQTFKMMKVREQTQKGTLSDDEIEKFLNLPCPSGQVPEIWHKDKMFFSILSIGSRPAEIAHITKGDVTDSTIFLRHTKTHKPRMIPIPNFVREEFLDYVNKCSTNELFLTSKGRMYSYSQWNHTFKKRMSMLGIHRPNLSLYSLRTSCATSLLKQDVSPFKVAKLLGNSVEIIERNYSHLVIEDLQKAIERLPIVSRHIRLTPQELGQQIETLLKLYDVTYSVKMTKHELQVKARTV